MTALLVLLVLVPAAAAVIAVWSPARAVRAIAVAAAAVAAGGAMWAAAIVGSGSHRELIAGLPWLADAGDSAVFGVSLDPIGTVLLLVVSVLGFLTVLYSTSYLSATNRSHATGERDQPRYYFWLLAFLASMTGVALSPNYLQLFFFWEMTTVCSWALIGFYRDREGLRAGFKALVMTAAGGMFFLAALLLLFVETGSFEFDAGARLGPSQRGLFVVLLMVAAWAKAAQLPFHTWLPDAMAAPTPISAYLHAAAMVKAGVYLMARTVAAGWEVPGPAAVALGAMALLTIFVALSFYFIQDDLKRLLAYSTIAHLGYVLLGVALGGLGSLTALRGGVLHILCHGFGKATLFLCAGAVAYATGSRSIAALGGLARSMPLTATAFFVGIASVTGIPPFACFWSKLMILAGALELPGAIGPTLVGLVLVESLISFAWLLHVAQRIFMGATTRVAGGPSDPPPPMSLSLVVLMLGCLVAPAVGLALLWR
jgi:hydrogenase-4 component D